METKVCKCCGRELPVENFAKNAFGYIGVCRDVIQRTVAMQH